jgi:hypothetical protein
MRTKRSIKDSLKEYLNWCVGRLLLGGSRDDTVRDMVDAISDEIASGGGGVSQDQLDQTVKDITKSYGIADQTVLTSAESYTDQKIADVVDGSPEALDTLYELAKALGDDSNFATTVMDQIGQKLPTTTFENFIDNKAWTKDNLTKLSQLINNINSIKAGTRVESMDVNLASISSYLEYDLFDNNTTGTKPPGLTTGFLLTFSWDNGGWGAQIATSDGNVDGAIFLRTIKASESDKIWGPWVSLYNTANFNPDSKLNYNGFNGDLNTISTSGLYRLVSGCTNTPNSGSSQGCHIIHTNWDTNAAHQLYFEYYGSMFYRYKHGGEWSDWKKVWTEFEFNPDDKFGFVVVSDLNNAPLNAVFSTNGTPANAPLENAYFQGFTFAMDNNPDFKRQWAFKDGKIWFRNLHAGSWSAWTDVIPLDNYLPLSGGKMITGDFQFKDGVVVRDAAGSSVVGLLDVAGDGVCVVVGNSAKKTRIVTPDDTPVYRNDSKGTYRIYDSGNFNPDSKFNNLGQTSDSNNVVGNGYTLKELGATFSGPFLKWGLPGHMFEFFSANRINEIQIRQMSQGVWGDPVIMYHSGNFNPSSKLDKSVWDEAFEIKTVDGVRVISAKLDFLSVAGISAYATGPSSGGGGGGLNIPAYIFPGDPSKLDSLASSTHITSILGTAIDLLDAFNNGRVFISKTVTFNEVQVPSDITYSLLKSIDPDNPTIFQIIMSTVVRGHYIEITIDFENNEYQAISNTINGIIGVNNTGTTN